MANTFEAIRGFFLIAAMWIRSTMVYRTSFIMLTAGQFVVTGMDFVVIGIMFSHTQSLGGFTLAEVAFLYGTSGCAMGVADLLVGNAERIGQRIRTGALDVALIRPLPIFVQAAADEFALRRVGRLTQSVIVLVWAIWSLDLSWTWDRVLLMPILLVSGSAIFIAIFVLGGAFQFAAQDAAEVANAFTYGGNFLTQYPMTIFAPGARPCRDVRGPAGVRQLDARTAHSLPPRSARPSEGLSVRLARRRRPPLLRRRSRLAIRSAQLPKHRKLSTRCRSSH